MTSVIVRPADSNDLDTIVEFNCRLAQETEEKQLHVETVRAGVGALLSSADKGRYFLACQDDRIVGQIMLTYEWSDWRNGSVWWLQSVYVHPEYRRRGVFRAMCHHVEESARATAGVIGVRLYVADTNEAAQQTYREIGIAPAGYLVFEKLFTQSAHS